MVSGHLYCDICGAEYQIVPDFEPEIENSIARSMSDISESLDENKNLNKKERGLEKKSYKTLSFTLILFIVFISSVFVYLGYMKYTQSSSYQSKQAVEAFRNYDYYKAVQIYENIRKKDSSNAEWYIEEAKIRLKMEQEAEAYSLAITAIGLKENVEIAYDFLLSYLKEEENYIEMNEYLKSCEYEEIREKYREYLCEVPDINYESGNYDTALELSFAKGFQGTVYYTLDGTLPDVNSLKYEKPIKIGNGKHILTVVFENNYGIVSQPAVWEYQIKSELPMAPKVKVSSGKYKYAQMIEVEVEEGTRVYYTTDLSKPDEESLEYTAPIPMPLGESRFNFIAYSDKGIAGEVTQRNFMLNMKTNVSIEEAENILVQKLISTGHILDKNGAVQDRYGVFRYFYKFPISEAESNYYVLEEHYMENQINNPLGHFYAVDVLNGEVYKLLKDDAGYFVRIEF